MPKKAETFKKPPSSATTCICCAGTGLLLSDLCPLCEGEGTFVASVDDPVTDEARVEDDDAWEEVPSRRHTRKDRAGNPSAGDIAPFKVMTLNVQEYSYKGGVVSNGTLRGIHKLIKKHGPDIVCLQEHVMESKTAPMKERKLMKALLGDLPYEYTVAQTREWANCNSPFCNVLMWRTSVFSSVRCWGVQLREGRSAACAELIHFLTKQRVMACSTHLTGGRFEDINLLRHPERNVRGEQVGMIDSSFGRGAPSIIAGDFNAMLHGYNKGSHFRDSAHKYFQKLYAQEWASPPQPHIFDSEYVGHQINVHRVLGELGYTSAYKQRDDSEGMKTSLRSGCVDWIYARGLRSRGDEEIISAIAEELSDHNGVIVTLDFA